MKRHAMNRTINEARTSLERLKRVMPATIYSAALAALAAAIRYARNGDAPGASIALDALKSLIDAFTC